MDSNVFKKNRIINFIFTYKYVFVYLTIILALLILRESNNSHIAIQAALVLSLWFLPFKMQISFKAVNTFILAYFLSASADSLINNSYYHINYLSLLLITALFFSLLINIFVVIKDFYIKRSRGNTIKIGYGFRLAYIASSFITLIATVLLSYSRIYDDLFYLDSKTFSLAGGTVFNGFYYSCITYFTVGFGDIIPSTTLSRTVSLTQMIIGYFITCLIIPILLIAIQKLFQVTKKKSRPE